MPIPRNDQFLLDAATDGWRRMRIDDLHGFMQGLELGPSVPDKIRQPFDTARNAFV